MSVLNPNSDEEPLECPLCMEYLELDDINFYPCSCGYQICRFCWNKIRTEGNGNCPACRSIYTENPADFKPLTREEMAKIKAEKRQKDQAKKQKISENRKHLANVRVVQKNLVFVVGLSPRLSDAEVLRKQEYFGKFGKIHKVVINTSTAYAGNQNQGPSASAYVTYYRSDDALRAIQVVNNIYIDGRTLKASLGTTKYCSHFMKNQPCPKPDCMYLHELGDEAASFTKEGMQQGKHTEYEKNLHEEMILNRPPDNNSSSSVGGGVVGSGGGGGSSNNSASQSGGGGGGGGSSSTAATAAAAAATNGHRHPTTAPPTADSRPTNDNSRHVNDNDTAKQKVITNNINSTKTAATAATAAECVSNGISSSRTPSPKSAVSSSSSGGGSCQLLSNSSSASVTSSQSSGAGAVSSSAAVPVPTTTTTGGGDGPEAGGWPPNTAGSVTVASSSYRDNDSPDFVSQLSNSEGPTSAGVLATSQPKSEAHENRVDSEHQISSSIPTDIRDHGWDPLGSRTESKDDLFGEDDLGFDPFHETQKALAEMLESESNQQWQPSPPPPPASAPEGFPPPAGFNSHTQTQAQQLGNGTATSSATSGGGGVAAAPPPGLGGPMTSSSGVNRGGAGAAKQPPPGFNMMNFSGGLQNSAVPNLLSSDIHGFGGLDSFSAPSNTSNHTNGFANHLVNGRDNDGFGFSGGSGNGHHGGHHHPHGLQQRFSGLGGHRNPSGGSGGFPHLHPSDLVNRSRPDSGGSGGGSNALDQLQQQFRHMAMQQQQQQEKGGQSATASKDWQDGFRALLPNVNVSFGALPQQHHHHQQQEQQQRAAAHLLGHGDVLEGSSRFNNLPTSVSGAGGGGNNSNSMLNEVLGVGGGGASHSPGNHLNNGHLDRALHHQQNMRQHNSGWHGMGGVGNSHGTGVNDWGVMDPAIVGGQLSDGHPGHPGHHHHQQHHHPHHPHQRADSPPNWIKANLEQLTSDGERGFNIGPLHAFSQFANLSSPPPPQSAGRQSAQQQGGSSSSGGLAGWLANTPPPGFSLNSRTAGQLQQQQQQQQHPFQNLGAAGAAVAASDLESEFQRLIHSK